MRSVFGAGMGYAAAKASGASSDQMLAAMAKGVEVMNQGTAVGEAAAALSAAFAASANNAATVAPASAAATGPSTKGTTPPGTYPTKPNRATGQFCPGFTMENFETKAFQGGNDTQLFTMCGQAFNYYRMYLNAIRQGYAEADANRTYDAHVKSARVAEQFYRDTRSTGGIRVP
jgi:hypothetical protein